MVWLRLLMGTLLLIHDATVHIQNHLILEILQTYLRNLLVLLLKWQKLTYFSTLKSKGTSFVFVERSITSSSAEPGRKIFAIISWQLGASSHSSASRIPSTSYCDWIAKSCHSGAKKMFGANKQARMVRCLN